MSLRTTGTSTVGTYLKWKSSAGKVPVPHNFLEYKSYGTYC